MKLISIIIALEYWDTSTEKCLNSILSQSYSKIELVIIDCCGISNILNDIFSAKKINNIKIEIIRHKCIDISEAWNTGINVAEGDYIAFVNCCDWVSLDMYKRLIRICEESKAEIAACSFYLVKNDKATYNMICDGEQVISNNDGIIDLIHNKSLNNYTFNKIFQKSLFEGIRYPINEYARDLFTIYKLFRKANKIALVGSALYFYNRSMLCLESEYNDLRYIGSFFNAYYKRYVDMVSEFENQKSYLAEQVLQFGKLYIHRFNEVYTYSFLKKNCIIEDVHEKMRIIYSKRNELSYKIKFEYFVSLHLPFLIKYLPLIYKKIKIVFGFYQQSKISILTSCSQKVLTFPQNVKKVLLFGLPEHNNLGDHAIRIAEVALIKECLPEYELVEISETNTNAYIKAYKKRLSKDDLIVLTGGGDIGNQYKYIEHRRQKIISSFKNSITVIMPQTMFFTKDSDGKKELKRAVKKYSSHKKLIIYMREIYSYEFAIENFPVNTVKLCPDIVLSLQYNTKIKKRTGALLCLRSDCEGVVTVKMLEEIRSALFNRFNVVNTTDTAINRNVELSEQENEIVKKLNEFSQYSLVITDRLHGAIFSAITTTPCIILSNYNHKIEGVFQFLNMFEYMQMAKTTEQVCEMINDFDESNFNSAKYCSNKYYESYKNIFSDLRC